VGSDLDLAKRRDRLLGYAADPEHLESFVADLEALGYSVTAIGDGIGWVGPVPTCLVSDGHTTTDTMTVTFHPAWPYLPPLLEVEGVASWHANQDRLCLWREGDATRQWATVAGLFERVDTWSASARDGFADAPGTLSPEVYWGDGRGDGLFGLVDVERLIAEAGGDSGIADGHAGRFTFLNHPAPGGGSYPDIFELAKGKFTSNRLPSGVSKSIQAVGRFFYRGVAAGLRPPRDWAEFLACLTDDQRSRIETDLNDPKRTAVGTMLLWDTGDGTAALMVLHRRDTGTNDWDRELVVLRPDGIAPRLRRAGPDAAKLGECSVAVLGVGAIGSYTADLLARSGVGELTLVDGDTVWPVNVVRFAVGSAPTGAPKTYTLKWELALSCPWTTVETVETRLWTPSTIARLAARVDLVIDTTGDVGHMELTGRMCEQEGTPLVAGALFRGGTVARVQRQADGDTPLWRRTYVESYPEIEPLPDEAEYVGLETGCLAPVHNAPPTAVARAAALTAEVAIDLLTGRLAGSDDVIDVIRPTGGWLDTPGRISGDDLPLRVDLTESARATMIDAADRSGDDETGGVLLGLLDEGRPVVTRAVEVPARHPCPDRYLLEPDAIDRCLVEARATDPDVGYLGSWHTHPAGGPPSETDAVTFQAVTDEPTTGQPVFLVVAGQTGTGERITGYRATTSKIRPAAVLHAGDVPAHPPQQGNE
jgi:molybdopterin/thiamine biosynthesis adenylyltransferase/proteasome lid subunit RPN8/RPN11